MASIKVSVNGYGVIGKRVADAVALQPDMELVGVADVATDYRVQLAVQRGYPLFGSTAEAAAAMRAAGLDPVGDLGDVLPRDRSPPSARFRRIIWNRPAPLGGDAKDSTLGVAKDRMTNVHRVSLQLIVLIGRPFLDLDELEPDPPSSSVASYLHIYPPAAWCDALGAYFVAFRETPATQTEH